MCQFMMKKLGNIQETRHLCIAEAKKSVAKIVIFCETLNFIGKKRSVFLIIYIIAVIF